MMSVRMRFHLALRSVVNRRSGWDWVTLFLSARWRLSRHTETALRAPESADTPGCLPADRQAEKVALSSFRRSGWVQFSCQMSTTRQLPPEIHLTPPNRLNYSLHPLAFPLLVVPVVLSIGRLGECDVSF